MTNNPFSDNGGHSVKADPVRPFLSLAGGPDNGHDDPDDIRDAYPPGSYKALAVRLEQERGAA